MSDIDTHPMTRFGQSLKAATEGRTDYLSWRALITGAPPRPEEIRRFIEVKPALDFNALEPGPAPAPPSVPRRAIWAFRRSMGSRCA